MNQLTLVTGSRNHSPWSLRPWLLLRQFGIPFDEIRLPIGAPERFPGIDRWSPDSGIPVLKHGSLTVRDSLAIAEYLNETLAPGRIWPAGLESRALARSVAAEIHSNYHTLRRELPMDVTGRHAPELSADCRADIAQIQSVIRDCRLRHGHGGPWLFGVFSAADAMLAPVASRFATYDVPMDDTVAAWQATVLDCEAMRAWRTAALAETEILAADEAGEPV